MHGPCTWHVHGHVHSPYKVRSRPGIRPAYGRVTDREHGCVQSRFVYSAVYRVHDRRVHTTVVYTTMLAARVHGRSQPVQTVYTVAHNSNTAVYMARAWPCTGHKHGLVYGACTSCHVVNDIVLVTVTWPRLGIGLGLGFGLGPCTGSYMTRARPCLRPMYTAVHGPCTWSVHDPYTAVHGRVHGL